MKNAIIKIEYTTELPIVIISDTKKPFDIDAKQNTMWITILFICYHGNSTIQSIVKGERRSRAIRESNGLFK